MKKQILITLSVLTLLVVFAAPVSAGNWWNGFKWEGTSLSIKDNLDPGWSTTLGLVKADWNDNSVLTLSGAADDDEDACSASDIFADNPRNVGRIEVCNRNYENNGWLGIARVWVDGLTITSAVAAVNDYYLGAGAAYDNDNARQHVLCQEIGHTLGLDHQGSPRKQSCMNARWGLTSDDFVSPNAHDYTQLAEIYGLSDGGDGGGGGLCARKPEHRKCQQRTSSFEVQRLGNGRSILTWITWAPGRGPSD